MTGVSAVIPTYNRAHFVREAVESVLEQTVLPDEIIVVDDGSTDDTREALAPFGDRIRLLYQPNRGKSAARNAGIAAARGEWIAFLDSDDLWHPRRMEVLRAFLVSPPAGIGLVFGNYLPRHGTTDGRPALEEQELFPALRRHGLRLADALPEAGVLQCGDLAVPHRVGSAACHLFFGNFVLLSGAAIRAEALRECGPFRESWDFAEDWELCLRLARRHRFAYLDFPLCVYRHHPDQAIATTSRLAGKSLVAQVVEKNLDLIEGMPEPMRREARRRVGRAFRGRASAHLRMGRTDGVREDALSSLRYEPLRPDAVLYALLGLLPAGMTRAAAAALRHGKPRQA